MDDLDLDISQLSALDLQRLKVTVARIRAVHAAPNKVFGPEETGFPGVYHFAGLTSTGRVLSVALAYVEATERVTALGIEVVTGLRELRLILCE